MSRNWIKLYVDQCLRGTMISELPPEGRWVWVGLLLMAGDSNQDGIIYLRKDIDGSMIGYSHNTISELLGVSLNDYRLAIGKMIQYDKISINERDVITITNWNKYQSEYLRQKKYRKESQFDLELDGENTVTEKNVTSAVTKVTPQNKIKNKNKNKIKNIYMDEFKLFWTVFYDFGKKMNCYVGSKPEALKAWKALMNKKVDPQEIAKGMNGYLDYLKTQWSQNSFKQKIQYASTFLRNDKWREFIDYRYDPEL
jgi:hypothetical protein